MIHIFGIRHLSGNTARQMLAFLDSVRPRRLLLEWPSDAAHLFDALLDKDTVLPAALLAHKSGRGSFVLPLAEFSPEYQALLWAKRNNAAVEAIDLPCGFFFDEEENYHNNPDIPEAEELWARQLTGVSDPFVFARRMDELGRQLRLISPPSDAVLFREAYMRHHICEFNDQMSVVICGAYHTSALDGGETADAEGDLTEITLIPYTNGRLIANSPRFQKLLLDYDNREMLPLYLSELARELRVRGMFCSSGSVIETVRLVQSVETLKGYFTLQDTLAAAKACMGGGEDISEAVRAIDTPDFKGCVPRSLPATVLQRDVASKLSELKLDQRDKHEWVLDIRKNSKRKTSPFLDLHRSRFLHQLTVLGVPFVSKKSHGDVREVWTIGQDYETSLAGVPWQDKSTEQAASMLLCAWPADGPAELSRLMYRAAECGMEAVIASLFERLEALPDAGFTEMAQAFEQLGNLSDAAPLRQLRIDGIDKAAERLFTGACHSLPFESNCGDFQVKRVWNGLRALNSRCLDGFMFARALEEISMSSGTNPAVSGFAAALRLARGEISRGEFEIMFEYRIQGGFAAQWLEGFVSYNREMLLRHRFWFDVLDKFVSSSDEERFLSGLTALRRMFSFFTEKEKQDIIDMLSLETADLERNIDISAIDGFDFGKV